MCKAIYTTPLCKNGACYEDVGPHEISYQICEGLLPDSSPQDCFHREPKEMIFAYNRDKYCSRNCVHVSFDALDQLLTGLISSITIAEQAEANIVKQYHKILTLYTNRIDQIMNTMDLNSSLESDAEADHNLVKLARSASECKTAKADLETMNNELVKRTGDIAAGMAKYCERTEEIILAAMVTHGLAEETPDTPLSQGTS